MNVSGTTWVGREMPPSVIERERKRDGGIKM